MMVLQKTGSTTVQRRQAFREREPDMARRHADIMEQQGTPRSIPSLALDTQVRVQKQVTNV